MTRRELFAAAFAVPVAAEAISLPLRPVDVTSSPEISQKLKSPLTVPIEVDGMEIEVVSLHPTIAEGKPNGNWRRFEVTGIVATDLNGDHYWLSNPNGNWERC